MWWNVITLTTKKKNKNNNDENAKQMEYFRFFLFLIVNQFQIYEILKGKVKSPLSQLII